MNDYFDYIIYGFGVVLSIKMLILIVIGSIIGIIVGIIPGMTATMAVAVIIPITFSMTAQEGMSILMAVYVGGISGGLISAILLNMPGTPSSVATTFDGYPMAQKGLGGQALGLGITCSFIGGTIGLLVLMTVSPMLSRIAIKLGPTEYFSLLLFAMTMVVYLSADSLLKGTAAAVVGLLLATVGTDPITAFPRFTFGYYQLQGGIALLPAAIGMYAISQILVDIEEVKGISVVVDKTIKKFLPTLKELKFHTKNIIRSSIIGVLIGILPGVGGATSNLMAYSQAKKASRYPEKFGTGIPDGVVAPETANNATIGGALVPMMALGIPGDTVTAMLLGGLMIHGLKPGPLLFVEHSDVVYTIFAAFFMANIVTFLLQTGGIKIFINVLNIPKHILLPLISFLCIIGAFATNNRIFDVWILLIFGILGYLMRKIKISLTPLLLGLILGPMAEVQLRTALSVRNHSLTVFLKPFSLFFIILTILPLILFFYGRYREKHKNSR